MLRSVLCLEAGPVPLAPFDLRDEENFAAWAQRLQIANLMDFTIVNRDGGFLFETDAQTGVELIKRFDVTAQVSRLNRKFACAVGRAAAEPARKTTGAIVSAMLPPNRRAGTVEGSPQTLAIRLGRSLLSGHPCKLSATHLSYGCMRRRHASVAWRGQY